MPDHAIKIELFDQFGRVAQALASGRRIEILDVLANGERGVEELARQVDMSVANTSRHLQILKDAGLLAATRQGTRVRYRLASAVVYEFWVALRSLASERLPGVQRLVEAYLGSRGELEAISGGELLARLEAGEPLMVVDVRPLEEYQAAHVPGAGSSPLAELVAVFSLAMDLGLGQPMEHVLRSWLIAARLGDHLGVGREQRGSLFYVVTLAWVGCVADTPEVATWFGDDIAYRGDSYRIDLAGLPLLGFMRGHVGAGKPALDRLRLAANLVATGGSTIERGMMSHCL